jgi:hypothetical protein
VALRQKLPIVVFKDFCWSKKIAAFGSSYRSSRSHCRSCRRLRSFDLLGRGHFLRQPQKRRRQPCVFSLLEAVQILRQQLRFNHRQQPRTFITDAEAPAATVEQLDRILAFEVCGSASSPWADSNRAFSPPGSCCPGGQPCKTPSARHSAQPSLILYLRNRRKPLNTTNRLTPMSANTAIHMVASPAKVTPRKIALMTNARAMFCLRMLDVCRDR